MSELFTQKLGNQGIQVPAGTIVNGEPFKKYGELKKRIAELEEELKALKPEPSIPDWIAPGKWVDLTSAYALVDRIENGVIHYKKTVWINLKDPDTITYEGRDALHVIIKHAKPFTPPPCPELPYPFEWSSYGDWINRKSTRMPLEAWIAAAQAHKKDDTLCDVRDSLPQFIAIRDHIEKWGDES
jgi:hypothetical protein